MNSSKYMAEEGRDVAVVTAEGLAVPVLEVCRQEGLRMVMTIMASTGPSGLFCVCQESKFPENTGLGKDQALSHRRGRVLLLGIAFLPLALPAPIQVVGEKGFCQSIQHHPRTPKPGEWYGGSMVLTQLKSLNHKQTWP